MESTQLNWIAGFIWGIADDVLRDTYTRTSAFIHLGVMPYESEAWIDGAKMKTDSSISFTRFFFKTSKLRTLEAFRADIVALQKETEGLLEYIIGAGK